MTSKSVEINPESKQCLNLDIIMSKFSSPLTEEHAWAIIFECLKLLATLAKVSHKIHLVRSTRDVFLDVDGKVNEATFLDRVVINPDGKQDFFSEGGKSIFCHLFEMVIKMLPEEVLLPETGFMFRVDKSDSLRVLPRKKYEINFCDIYLFLTSHSQKFSLLKDQIRLTFFLFN